MRDLTNTMDNLDKHESSSQPRTIVSFSDFLQTVVHHPERYIRDVYQVYSDLIHKFVSEGHDEYMDDPESISYLNYNCQKLFVEGSDRPFFADRLFANRLMRHVESLLVGAQQNKIYIFDGPHGSGKSTFLNNLLRKFEEYANTSEGTRYEVVWRLPHEQMVGAIHNLSSLTEKLAWALKDQGSSDMASKIKDIHPYFSSDKKNNYLYTGK